MGVVPGIMRGLPAYARLRRYLTSFQERRGLDLKLDVWQGRRDEVLATGRQGYRRPPAALGILWQDLGAPHQELDHHSDLVIADIDQDGFLLSRVGDLRGAPTVAPERFLPRRRFDLQVVVRDGVLAVRKDFKGDRGAFVRELTALHELAQAGCNVPAVLDFDVDGLVLTVSYVVGAVLREELARRGALLRDRDVRHRGLLGPTSRLREHQRIARGRELLDTAVGPDFAARYFAQLRKVHAAGYVLHDIKYGNVVIEQDSGAPYLIDFDAARTYPSVGYLTRRFLRDQDYRKFNRHFAADELTHERVRRLMKRRHRGDLGEFYAPVYIPGGLRFGAIWNVDVGNGRWHYLLEHSLPPLGGKRVLDLGANNGFNALQMLRSGARQAVAVEMDQRVIPQARFLKRLYEWADNTDYDLLWVHDDMGNVPVLELGRFDLVTALCSIYYLEDDQIAKLVRFLSRITDTMALECNTDLQIERTDPHTYEKASVAYAVNVLKRNGFSGVDVIAPSGYSRPLVIGRNS
jgi:serine/threonine protein kinase